MTEGIHLSRRERQVLVGMVNGHTDKDTAALLGVTSRTIRSYVGRIKEKFAAPTREAVAARAVAMGMVQCVWPDDPTRAHHTPDFILFDANLR